jgi:hypothetical protein
MQMVYTVMPSFMLCETQTLYLVGLNTQCGSPLEQLKIVSNLTVAEGWWYIRKPKYFSSDSVPVSTTCVLHSRWILLNQCVSMMCTFQESLKASPDDMSCSCSLGCKHWNCWDSYSDQNNMKLSNTLQRETVVHEQLEFWQMGAKTDEVTFCETSKNTNETHNYGSELLCLNQRNSNHLLETILGQYKLIFCYRN